MEFDLEWLYDIYYLEIWHVFSIIFTVAFTCYIYLNARKSRLLYHYLVIQGILLAWLIAKVFKTIAPTMEIKWCFIVVQYLFICFMGSAFLMFGYLYARGKPLPLKISIPLNIPPLFFFFVIATNECHHLFYTTYDFLGDSFGPLFYAYTALTYIYLAIGLYYCATCFRKQIGNKNIQARLLTVGIVIPLFVNALYVCGFMEPRFDITPVSCNISLILFAFAIYKYQFLDVIPLGINSSFHNLREGVLVLDMNGTVLDKNKAMVRVLPFLPADSFPERIEEVEREIEKACGKDRAVVSLADFVDEEGVNEKTCELVIPGEREKYFTVYAKPLSRSGKGPPEHICVFIDNTEYRDLISQLEEKNRELETANSRLQKYIEDLRQLAVLEERNRMAGEIHDVLGHSLVLVLNILESCNILMDYDREKARIKMKQAVDTARLGMEELNNTCRVMRGKDVKSVKQLERAVHQLADKYRLVGINVDLTVSSRRKKIPADFYHTVFRICQEGLTNALKHGQARQVNIFIRINPREVELFVLDDGKGCAWYKKGNGLTGMEQRINKLRGVLSCGSSEGEGFSIHARIPG